MTADLQRYAKLGLKVAITEADVRTFVNNAADQVLTDHLATFAQPYEFSKMLKACLAVQNCISFTVWGFGDVDMQEDLTLAARGAPRRGFGDEH
jgi:endo-1,4-beta-xylanase